MAKSIGRLKGMKFCPMAYANDDIPIWRTR